MTRRGGFIAAGLGLIALVLPLVLAGSRIETYATHVAVQIMLLGMLALAWDFTFGFVGLFSFGHAAMFGVGGYVAAILYRAGLEPGVGILLVAVLSATLVGAAMGALAARVGSVAVFLVTFALAEAIYLTAIANPFGLTNGDNGLLDILPRSLLGIDLASERAFYYLALAALAGCYLALRGAVASRFGLVLVAIRENETRVRFAGYDVELYKTVAFAMSGAVAGLSGVLTAWHGRIAAPESLAWSTSSEAVLYATLGGTGTLLGPVLGTAVVTLAREVLSDVVRSWLIFVAVTYLALVFLLPDGLYALLDRMRLPAVVRRGAVTLDDRS